ncbi:MAG: hypothetical protein ACKVOJ_07780 [Sphingomonadaceae bacterium]
MEMNAAAQDAPVETKAIAPYSAKAWTRERQAIFLDTLAATSNVKASATAAGLPEASAYRLRRESAAFRASWEAALCEGYAKLELMMLERAMKALRRISEPDAAKSRMDDYSNKLAMGLLAAHRGSAKGAFSAATPARRARPGTAKSRVLKQLGDMRERANSDS